MTAASKSFSRAAFCLVIIAIAAAQVSAREVRISELRNLTGQEATVRGRTGIIVEAEEKQGWKVFTLRDDYGDQVYVRSKADHPIMGATWDITGRPEVDAATGTLYLTEVSRQRSYPPVGKMPGWLLPGVGGIVLLGVGVVGVMIRRRSLKGELAPAWGYAEIVSGPDQGKNFALRGDEIVVGREQDPAKAVSIVLDQHVSRRHGKILKTGDDLFYEDCMSKCGSWVNEMQAEPGQQVLLATGSLLRLGPQTIIRIGLAGNVNETHDWGDGLGQNAGEAVTGGADEVRTD